MELKPVLRYSNLTLGSDVVHIHIEVDKSKIILNHTIYFLKSHDFRFIRIYF